MNDNKKVKELIKQIETSRAVLLFLWNTGKPTHRMRKPLENATKYFRQLKDAVVFDESDLQKIEEHTKFFLGFQQKLNEQS